MPHLPLYLFSSTRQALVGDGIIIPEEAVRSMNPKLWIWATIISLNSEPVSRRVWLIFNQALSVIQSKGEIQFPCHGRHTHRQQADAGRGRSRLPAGSRIWDSIPGPQDHYLSQRQTLNHWAIQLLPIPCSVLFPVLEKRFLILLRHLCPWRLPPSPSYNQELKTSTLCKWNQPEQIPCCLGAPSGQSWHCNPRSWIYFIIIIF